MTVGLVHALLDEAVQRAPDAPAISDGRERLTYAELAARSDRAAAWLCARGVRPGDRVVLRLPGDADFAALLYAVLRIGAVAVPVHPASPPYQLGWILRDSTPALVVTTTDDVTAVGELTAVAVSAPQMVDGPLRPADPAPTDVALLLYTSGSTAMPKAVVSPHERVRFAVEAIATRLRYTAGDVVFCRSPMSFDYGLYQLFLCALAGASLELRPWHTDVALLREIRVSRATVLPTTPAVATMLLRLVTRDDRPTSVRLITSTGARLTPALAAGLRKAFPIATIVAMYGMTECKRITIAEPDEDLRHPGTVGRALDGTEVTVADDRGRPVPPGVVGEIWVRGPHVMAGYWRAPDQTAQRYTDPHTAERLLRTGDHGYLDEEGRLYFTSRRDDIFKRKGVRTSVPEIESAALDVPGVRAAAVVRPAEDGELVLWAVTDLQPEDVLAGVFGRLERAKMPDRCLVVPALPTTANGKVDKAALQDLLVEAADQKGAG